MSGTGKEIWGWDSLSLYSMQASSLQPPQLDPLEQLAGSSTGPQTKSLESHHDDATGFGR